MFSDGAPTSIQGQPARAAPFTGSYRPARRSSAFDQQSPQGTWTLEAVDDLPSDAGSIRAFSLQITSADCTTANAAPDPNQAYVTAVYADFLSRTGDAGGTRTGPAGSIAPSRRARRSCGDVRSHEYSVKTVTRAFNDVLGRNPDPSGREFWANRVQAGMPAATLVLNLIASNEHLTKAGGHVEGFVTSTFHAILARQPTAGERSARVSQIDGGTSRLSVASELYVSTESRQRRTRTQFQLLLGRTPTSSELSSWVADLATRSDVDLAIFLGAGDEYYAGAQTLRPPRRASGPPGRRAPRPRAARRGGPTDPRGGARRCPGAPRGPAPPCRWRAGTWRRGGAGSAA